MQGVDIGKQLVINAQLSRRGGATGFEAQHGIGAIAVMVDLHALRPEWTCTVLQAQSAKGISADVCRAWPHLTPGQLAIAIGVEQQRHVQVAQRNIPAPMQLRAIHHQRQIAVARFMRAGQGAAAQGQQ